MQNLASIQQRTSLIKFDHLAEKSEKGSISNLSTKVERGTAQLEFKNWRKRTAIIMAGNRSVRNRGQFDAAGGAPAAADLVEFLLGAIKKE